MYVSEKTLAQDVFWQKMKSWWGKDTDQNISVRFLTLLIFAVGWALCGRPQPEHASVMLLLSLFPLNVLIKKTLSSVRKHLRKWFGSYLLFIHEHLIIIVWSPTVNLIAVTTLLLTPGLHRCQQRIFKKNTNYFYAVRISVLLAILSEIFIKIGDFF